MFTGYAFASFHRTALNPRPNWTPIRANAPQEESDLNGRAQWLYEAAGDTPKEMQYSSMLLLQTTMSSPKIDQKWTPMSAKEHRRTSEYCATAGNRTRSPSKLEYLVFTIGDGKLGFYH
jgi:hypothetical protein